MKDSLNIKDKYFKAPGYQYPIKVDHMDGFTGKSIDKYAKHGGGRSAVVDVFGCHACRWINTELCPHKGDVTHMKHHANGICSQRLAIPMQLHDEGIKMTGKQMLQVRGLMDAEYFSKYVQDAALQGKRDINDVFPWEKLKADILKDMRKQDEGSKLTIDRKINPSDINDLLNKARTIDVVPSQTKELEVSDAFDSEEADS